MPVEPYIIEETTKKQKKETLIPLYDFVAEESEEDEELPAHEKEKRVIIFDI